MIVLAAMVIGVVAACVAPYYCCKESPKSAENDDVIRPRIVVSQHEPVESPQMQIQMRHPRRRKVLRADSPQESCDTPEKVHERGFCEKSQNGKCDASHEPESFSSFSPAPFSSNTTEEKPSADQKRRHLSLLPWKRFRRTRTRTRTFNNNIERNDTSKGTPPGEKQASSSKDNTSMGGICSSSPETANCGVTEVVTVQIEAPPEDRESTGQEQGMANSPATRKFTPLTKILLAKLKVFKRSLQRKKIGDSSSFKEMPEGSSTCHTTPVGHSTVLPKRRVIDEKPSARDKTADSKRVNCLLLNNAEQNTREGLKTIGLRVSQAELLSGTNGHNAVILVAEEESVISVGFHGHDRHGQESLPAFTECVMQKLCKSLPVKFQGSPASSFFRAQSRSRSRSFHAVRETRPNVDSGISNDTSDETSYVSFSSRNGKNQFADNLRYQSRIQSVC